MVARTKRDIAGVRAAGRLVRRVFDAMRARARPGITTAELDRIAHDMFDRYGARSAPAHFYDFPGATCISLNEEAAHGVPDARRLKQGDLINIDVSAEYRGYVADMGESFVVGRGRRAQQRICDSVRKAVEQAAGSLRAGVPLNTVGRVVQGIADRRGYEIVRNLGSHGVGRHIHEDPSYIPRDDPGERRRIPEGLVFTIEPFFTTGDPWVSEGGDGWTLSVPPGQLVAQHEHTVLVHRGQAEILTA